MGVWLFHAGVCLVIGLVITYFARLPVKRPAASPATAGPVIGIDLTNPYAASSAPLPQTVPQWAALRSQCRYMRLTSSICWGLVVNFVLMSFVPREFVLVVLGIMVLCGLLVIPPLWESPTRNKALSFARWAVLARGVPSNQVRDEFFVGVSQVATGENIGNSSDRVGFLQLTDTECLLHLYDGDVVIPRHRVLGLSRVRPTGETMAWFGLRVLGVTWRAEGQSEPATVYLIAWDGLTAFAMIRATERMSRMLTAWTASAAQPGQLGTTRLP